MPRLARAEAERDRYRKAIEEAGGLLSMMRCPYYQDEGTCETGCHDEPRCVTDTPTEGWPKAALDVLEAALDQKQED